MTDTDHPSNGSTPSWWPAPDAAPQATVINLPEREPAGIGAAPFPPMPPQPPAPPPPPPAPMTPSTEVAPADDVPGRPRRPAIRDMRGAAHRNRRWIAIGGACVIGLVAVRMFANDVSKSMGNAVAEPLATHNSIVTDIVAEASAKNSAPSQVSVQQPLSWLNCPVANDAATMIGWDPQTQFATLDPGRASRVETQVRALVVSNPLSAMRITADSPTSLTVMVGGTKGVPLVDCSGATTPARQDPSKQGGDTATTAAPR